MKPKMLVLMAFLPLLGQVGPYVAQPPVCVSKTVTSTLVSYQDPDFGTVYGCRAYYVLLPVVANGGSESTKFNIANMNEGIVVFANPFSLWYDVNAVNNNVPFVMGFDGGNIPGPNVQVTDLLGKACDAAQPCAEATSADTEIFDGMFVRVTAPDADSFDKVTVYGQLKLTDGQYLASATRTDELTNDWTSPDRCLAKGQPTPYGVANLSLQAQAVEITARDFTGKVVGQVFTPVMDPGTKDGLDPTEIYPGPTPQMGYIQDLFPGLPWDSFRYRFCGTFEFRGLLGDKIVAAVPQLNEPMRGNHGGGGRTFPNPCGGRGGGRCVAQ